METDKAKRDAAVDAFAAAIKARLDEQAARGYAGWDGEYPAHMLHIEMQEDVSTLSTAWRKCVDIGARAMMLHYRRENSDQASAWDRLQSIVAATPPAAPVPAEEPETPNAPDYEACDVCGGTEATADGFCRQCELPMERVRLTENDKAAIRRTCDVSELAECDRSTPRPVSKATAKAINSATREACAQPGLNPERLSDEILAKGPRGSRLVECEEERRAFVKTVGVCGHQDLYLWDDGWVGNNVGNGMCTTYITTRPPDWW